VCATSLLLGAAAVLSAASAVAAESELICDETWRCLFADSEATFHVHVRASDKRPDSLHWSLVMADRSVASGDVPVDANAQAVVNLTLPPVKPTVVLDAVLVFSVNPANAADDELTLKKPLAIFPREAFTSAAQYRQLDIALFDPRKTTAEVLTKAGLPLKQLRTVEALRASESKFIIIGEGLPADRHGDIPQALSEITTAGKTAICLAPASGHWRLPAWSGEQAATRSIALRRGEAIQEFDSRFDAAAWPGVPQPIAGGLVLEAFRGQFGARIEPGENTWPWVEVRSATGGRIAFCGYGLIQHWEASPVPRYLIAKLLEQTGSEPSAPRNK
jgi:hypothetical protein